MSLLVATDGSDSAKAATGLALELAAASGDRILFVTAWRELRGDFGIPLHHLIPSLLEIERDWANETLTAAAAEAKVAGVEAETISRHGPAVEEICAVARTRRPRMIVLGTRGWGPIEGSLFGSVSTGVLQHAPFPVLVVPVRAGGEIGPAGKRWRAERGRKVRSLPPIEDSLRPQKRFAHLLTEKARPTLVPIQRRVEQEWAALPALQQTTT